MWRPALRRAARQLELSTNPVVDSSGAGALAGTTVMGWVGHRLSRRGVFFGGFLAVPVALAALALTPNLPVTLAILLALLATLFMPLPLALFAVRAFRDLGAPVANGVDENAAPSSSE